MSVPVRVGFCDCPGVLMPVMLVMDVLVLVFEGFMCMDVLVSFREVQPYTPRHERAASDEGYRDWLVQ